MSDRKIKPLWSAIDHEEDRYDAGFEAGRAAFAADLREQGKVVVERDALSLLFDVANAHGARERMDFYEAQLFENAAEVLRDA
jgi:hypothetical protein